MNGQGIAELRAAGVQVEVGLLEDEARRLNRGFVIVQTLGRPEVIVKAASSADGFIAARPGDHTTITAAAANRRVQRLRAVVDAVAVGSGTVVADDPLLTVRESARSRPLLRAVFDRRLRTPPSARLLSTLSSGPVIILTSARVLERSLIGPAPCGTPERRWSPAATISWARSARCSRSTSPRSWSRAAR